MMHRPNIPRHRSLHGGYRALYGNDSSDQTEASYPPPMSSNPFTYSEQRNEPKTLLELEREELSKFVFEDPDEDELHKSDTALGQQGFATHVDRTHLFPGYYSPQLSVSAPTRPIQPSFSSYVSASSASHSNNTSNTASIVPDISADASGHEDEPLEPIGKWKCCKCKKSHEVFAFMKGPHPLSTLNCVCTHRSCVTCTLHGSIKRFEPMNDPEIVQVSEDKLKQVRFGVVCDACGLSWRAQEVDQGRSKKSAMYRLSAIPKRLIKRRTHPPGTIRRSSSVAHLPPTGPSNSQHTPPYSSFNLRALSSEMTKGFGKQAELATVQFIGIQCTCGVVTDHTCLCFQIVEAPEGSDAVQPIAAPRATGISANPKDQAKGHGTPVLNVRGIQHENPLMSNPITAEDLL